MLPHQNYKHWTHSQKIHYANRTIFHAKHMLAWSMKRKFLIVNATNERYWSVLVRDHRWLLKYGLELKRKLTAPKLPAHIKGWLCIHGGEGAWNSDTGNGFYGGLQMTYGWMGLVVNAALLSPLQQMWAAEKGLMKQQPAFRYSWLSGQWPNTYPPCARHF